MEHQEDHHTRNLALLVVVCVMGAVIIGYQFHRPGNSSNAEHASANGTAFHPKHNKSVLDSVVTKTEMLKAEYMKKHDNGGAKVLNVVPHVANMGDTGKAWNDTPTRGMMQGILGTEAPGVESEPQTTAAPGGMPVNKPLYCAVPTGYLEGIVNAWDRGAREGLVQSNGLTVDMGHPGQNGFYDTTGDGCCDTYCRRVVKGGYWSCVTPNTITTQYTQMNPKGTLCARYGKQQGGSIH